MIRTCSVRDTSRQARALPDSKTSTSSGRVHFNLRRCSHMSSPTPGLRLLVTTHGGQGEDLDELDVWGGFCEDSLGCDSGGGSDDEVSGASDGSDEAEVPKTSAGHFETVPSLFKSSVPRTIMHPNASHNRTGLTVTGNTKTTSDPHKKPRTVSASLGALELGRRAAGEWSERRTLFVKESEDDDNNPDDETPRFELSHFGSFREGFVPPHIYATTHSTYSATGGAKHMEARFNGQQVAATGEARNEDTTFGGSMVTGAGHVLKGRDALKARTAVLRSTGFLEREPPGTPRELFEQPSRAGAKTPSPIAGFDVDAGATNPEKLSRK